MIALLDSTSSLQLSLMKSSPIDDSQSGMMIDVKYGKSMKALAAIAEMKVSGSELKSLS